MISLHDKIIPQQSPPSTCLVLFTTRKCSTPDKSKFQAFLVPFPDLRKPQFPVPVMSSAKPDAKELERVRLTQSERVRRQAARLAAISEAAAKATGDSEDGQLGNSENREGDGGKSGLLHGEDDTEGSFDNGEYGNGDGLSDGGAGLPRDSNGEHGGNDEGKDREERAAGEDGSVGSFHDGVDLELDDEDDDRDGSGGTGRGKPVAGRGRPIVQDGVVAPIVQGLSEADAADALKAHMKEKNRLAAQRTRAKRKLVQDARDDELEDAVRLRTLQEVATTPEGGFKAHVKAGVCHTSKASLMRSLRECAEYRGINLRFPINDRANVHATPATYSGVAGSSFDVRAKYVAKDKEFPWHVFHSKITGQTGSPPTKGHRKTAYRDQDLAAFVSDLLRGNPGAERKELVSVLKPVLRFPEAITANQFTRVRRLANIETFGKPDDNVKLLPEIRKQLESRGHAFDFTTVSVSQMKATIVACARDENAKLRAKALKVSEADRSPEQIADARSWLDASPEQKSPKKLWLERNADLMDAIAQPGNRFVDSAHLAFKHGLTVGQKYLDLFQLDACHGSGFLSQYTLFVIIAFTSNFQIIPLLYVWKCSNESKAAWKDVLQTLTRLYPWFVDNANITISSDRDKGIAGALAEVLPSAKQFFCYSHRIRNLAPFGKEAVRVFETLVYSKTLLGIEEIKSSSAFLSLRPEARAAILSVPDQYQFLAACVAAGGSTYGRTASTAVESQNGHVLDARALDLPNSVIWVGELEEKRFDRWSASASASADAMTPFVRARFDALSVYGSIELITAGNATEKSYLVRTFGGRAHTSTLVEQRNANGAVVSYFGRCSCGYAACHTFPCCHLKTVAVNTNINEDLIIPVQLTSSRWKEQYPAGLTVEMPSMSFVRATDPSELSSDSKLRLPVVAPPKRGRPKAKRARHGMEVSMRRNARRNGTG